MMSNLGNSISVFSLDVTECTTNIKNILASLFTKESL